MNDLDYCRKPNGTHKVDDDGVLREASLNIYIYVCVCVFAKKRLLESDIGKSHNVWGTFF